MRVRNGATGRVHIDVDDTAKVGKLTLVLGFAFITRSTLLSQKNPY